MGKRAVLWIGLAVWILGLGAGAAFAQKPQRQMPEEFIEASNPLGAGRAYLDARGYVPEIIVRIAPDE